MKIRNGRRWAALGVLMAVAAPVCIKPAEAAQDWTSYAAAVSANAEARHSGAARYAERHRGYGFARYGRTNSALQCVPFARDNSGIAIVGNAVNWWGKAAGVYERGSRPEVGSVLNFRATGRMYLGHVAVVSRVIDARNVQIDHANWSSRGAISRNISVIDVSPRNDWTAVRVALGQGAEFGSVYPTYGFIYDRPDHGTMIANVGVAAPSATSAAFANPLPTDGRVVAGVSSMPDEEVAEASDDTQPSQHRAAYGHAARTYHAPVMLHVGQGSRNRPYF